jgi:hypothetical protein
MVTISITREAFAAIEATLSKGSKAEARPVGKGGLFVVIDRRTGDRLGRLRGPGESYSDVILRIAKADGHRLRPDHVGNSPRNPEFSDT